MTENDTLYFKNASITSENIERYFTMFKHLLTKNLQSFISENI